MFLLQGAWLSLVTAFSSTAPLGDLISVPYACLEKMELPKETDGAPHPPGTAPGHPPGSGASARAAVCHGLRSVCHSILLVTVCKAGRVPS